MGQVRWGTMLEIAINELTSMRNLPRQGRGRSVTLLRVTAASASMSHSASPFIARNTIKGSTVYSVRRFVSAGAVEIQACPLSAIPLTADPY